MARVIKHLALWLLVLPWLACISWLWLDGIVRCQEFNLLASFASLPIDCIAGLAGVLFCLLITFPLGVVTCLLFSFAPGVMRKRALRIGLLVSTPIIGALWAQYTAKSLGTGRVEYLLVAIGFFAGLALGWLTLQMWRNKPSRIETSTDDSNADGVPHKR